MIEKNMFVEMPIKIKSYEVDYMQIVNNTVYLKWFEDLRMAIVDGYFPLDKLIADNLSPILAETTINYKRPLGLLNKPVGRAWMESMDKGKWVVRLEICDGDKICADGVQWGYVFNFESKRPVRFPDYVFQHIQEKGCKVL